MMMMMVAPPVVAPVVAPAAPTPVAPFDRTWDVPGVPREDEWKLALGVDTRGEEEEEDMCVLLK